MDGSGWITTKRLRSHALLLSVALWSVYIWTVATLGFRDRNGNLKGTDFLHFYTLGSLAIEHRGEALYDMNAQATFAAQRLPAAAGIRYLPLYPPQVSLLFVPFAHLSYANALALWWIVSGVIYAASCYCIWRVCPNLREHRGTVALIAAAFPGFFHLIAWGQTSALALACFTISFLCLRRRREFAAGLALGLLIFKPQLLVAAAIVFLSLGVWRLIAGASLSTLLEVLIGVLYYGRRPLLTWIHALWNAGQVTNALEPRPYQTYCLRTFWSMLIPWTSISLGLYSITAILVLFWTIQTWRRSREWEPRFSMLLLATILVSPHLTVYDLVILVPAFLFLADWLLGRRNLSPQPFTGILLYLVYMLPLIGFLAYWTHVQLSVVVMMFLAYQIWKEASSDIHLSDSSSAEPAGVAHI